MRTLDYYKNQYPKLFLQTQDYCPAGWNDIVLLILATLDSARWKDKNREEFVGYLDYLNIVQIKEKFGGLRFYFDIVETPYDFYGEDYTDPVNNHVHGVVAMAEMLSNHTCQVCGEKGKTRTYGGWYATLCEAHHEEASSHDKSKGAN